MWYLRASHYRFCILSGAISYTKYFRNMDPAKLKVVELRAELSSRGLDARGNKAALVERLREALEQETGEGEMLKHS